MGKSSNYQNARYSSVHIDGLHVLMLAIHRHPMIKLVSREELFSIFLEQAKRHGMPVTTARLDAAQKMLDTLELLTKQVTRNA